MGTSPGAAALYRELGARVLGYLRATGSPEPEDVLGEVFLQVARDLDGFPQGDDPEAVRRWIFTIARNRAIDAARRRARRPATTAEGVPDRAAPAVPASPDPELVAALSALTEEQRQVVLLRFVADLAIEDVARITGRTAGAVKAMQHRALEQLRQAVSPPAPPAL